MESHIQIGIGLSSIRKRLSGKENKRKRDQDLEADRQDVY